MVTLASGDSQLSAPESGSQKTPQEWPEDGGGQWYFSRKEIEENSPSRCDGIDLKKEAYLRKSYCTYLQDLGMRLKVPQVTIATAIIFCHRFYLRQSHAKNDRRTVATACMFLAGKVEETPRPLKDVILVSYEIIHKKDPAAVQKIKQKDVYEQQKELILIGERVVLATLGFDLNVQHPYKPLVEAIKKFKVAQNALAQVAWNFVNDGLRTSLCLQFKPHHIAAGAIFLAAKFLKVKLPSDGDKVWWQEFDVTPRQLEEVSNQMLELYEQNRAPGNQGSEAEGSVAGGAANRSVSRISSEDQIPNGSSSQVGAVNKPATLRPPTAPQLHDNSNKHVVPQRSSQNRSSEYGGSDHKAYVDDARSPEVLTLEEGQDVKTGMMECNTRDESKEKNLGGSRTRDCGDSKDKFHNSNNNVEFKDPVQTQSPSEPIVKIDANKLKELREKRRKSRSDVIRKKEAVDELDPILNELEEGVELAAAAENEKIKQERRQNWSKLSSKLDDDVSKGHQLKGSNPEIVEEGEVSALDDISTDSPSPKSNDRKRKAGGPLEKAIEGKRWRENDVSDEKSRVVVAGYSDRDHKRHVQENHT